MFRTLYAKSVIVLAALVTALVLVGWSGHRASDTGYQAVSELAGQRAKGIALLKEISDLYAVNIVDAAHKARNGNQDFATALAAVQTAQSRIAAAWTEFVGRALVSEMDKIREIESLADTSAAATASLVAILQTGDRAGLDTFVIDDLYPAVDPTTEEIGVLINRYLEAVDVTYQDYEAAMATFATTMMAIGVFATLIVILGLYVFIGQVFRPLNRVTDQMTEAANGDIDIQIDGIARRDEIGALARATASFVETARTASRLKEEASRDMTVKAARTAELERAVVQFRQEATSVLAAVRAEAEMMAIDASRLADTARTTEGQAEATSAATGQVTHGVQSVASATEELSASITEIASQVTASRGRIGEAVERADISAKDIEALEENVRHIDTVMALIRSIAEQTNLLALNATIEAARAGDQGRGFAVVASEVKNLAQRTSTATEEIGARIAAIQHSTGTASAGVRDIAERMKDVERFAAGIAASVEEQSAATEEISSAAATASEGVAKAADAVGGVASVAANTRASANDLGNRVKLVEERRRDLERSIEGFLQRVAS